MHRNAPHLLNAQGMIWSFAECRLVKIAQCAWTHPSTRCTRFGIFLARGRVLAPPASLSAVLRMPRAGLEKAAGSF